MRQTRGARARDGRAAKVPRAGERDEDVVSLIVHDIRAPLTVLAGYLDILGRPLSGDERAASLRAAKRATSRVNDLLDDLLSATRASDLLGPREMEPVRLDELAREVAASFAGVSDNAFEVDVSDEAVVLGDELRLRQALENLVTNAVKYSPPGTRIRICALPRDHRVVLAVEDEGPGVPSADRERVFARYVRLGDETERPGIGLGLYIVRAVAEGHGGTAAIEDASWSHGARLVMELPRAPAALAGRERQPARTRTA